jgi:hypothetical protein
MCRQGLFYIFNQAPSLNLQKIIQRHIIGKNWRFFLKWALNIGFLPPGTSMPCIECCMSELTATCQLSLKGPNCFNSDVPTQMFQDQFYSESWHVAKN